MRSTARRPEPEITFSALLGTGLSGLGRIIVRNPVAVGGTTAFLVCFAFVSANALWYQPHFHAQALISTRTGPAAPDKQAAPDKPEAPPPAAGEAPRAVDGAGSAPRAPSNDTTGAIPRERPVDEPAGGDPTVRRVQAVLADLGLYEGAVDGLQGPQTREAIGNYRRIVDLEPSDKVDAALLNQLGLETDSPLADAPQTIPEPTPRPTPDRSAQVPAPESAPTSEAAPESEPVRTAALEAGADEPDATIMRVQAGLKAFGNDGIEVDGVLGSDTKAAIREFQSLFGLPVSGRPDEPFLAKMREVGLTD